MSESNAAFPAPPHNFRVFKGRTERLLGWNEEGREVYARSPFSDSGGRSYAPQIDTRELLACSPGWYAITFYNAAEPDDLEKDAEDGTGWRFNRYPVVGWRVTISSVGYAPDNQNKFNISQTIQPLIPEVTDHFDEGEFANQVRAYQAPDGKVYEYNTDLVADSFENWCERKISDMKGST